MRDMRVKQIREITEVGICKCNTISEMLVNAIYIFIVKTKVQICSHLLNFEDGGLCNILYGK